MVLMSCSPKTVETVTEVDTENALPTAALNSGKLIFDTKCQKCHATENAKDYTTEQWAHILPEMSKKARLSTEEDANITAYIAWALEQ